MNGTHGVFTEQEFLNKPWTLNMESTPHSFSTPHDIQDFHPHFNDVNMTFPDLDGHDLPRYMTDEVQDNNPDVSSTLSPYQDLDSYQEINLSNSAVPSISPHHGDYIFHVAVQKQTKETKSVNWIYSEEMGKLYVRINVPCPFLFRTTHSPPRGSIIRATPIFWNPEHVSEVVKRCPTHMVGNQNEPRSQVKHLLTSDHREALHVEDPHSKRLCVIVPHEEPQVGSSWVTSLFRFMCFSSCHGGYNKRPLHIIFTLEHDNKVLGRQVMKVRLCACPGRDWEIETRPRNKKKKFPATQPSALRRSTQRDEVSSSGGQLSAEVRGQGGTPRKRIMVEEKSDEIANKMDNEEVFTLQVKGKVNYSILRKLRDSLHIFSLYKKDETSGTSEIFSTDLQSIKHFKETNTAVQQNHHHHHHQHNHHHQQQHYNNNISSQIVLHQNQDMTYYQQLSY